MPYEHASTSLGTLQHEVHSASPQHRPLLFFTIVIIFKTRYSNLKRFLGVKRASSLLGHVILNCVTWSEERRVREIVHGNQDVCVVVAAESYEQDTCETGEWVGRCADECYPHAVEIG